jgi:hypothetical protein
MSLGLVWKLQALRTPTETLLGKVAYPPEEV